MESMGTRGPETEEERTGDASRVEGKILSSASVINSSRISELDIVNTSGFDTYAIQYTNVNFAAQQRHSPASTRLVLYSKVVVVDVASLPTSSVCSAALSASTHVTC